MPALTQFALVFAAFFLMAPATAMFGERVADGLAVKHSADRKQ